MALSPPTAAEKPFGSSIVHYFCKRFVGTANQDNLPRDKFAAGPGNAGARICPILPHLKSVNDVDDSDASSNILIKQIDAEAGNALQYRTCSWRKTAALLFSEYICLAIMSFPLSYSVLGLVPGVILTVAVAMLVLYTSLVVW
jgi:hypothetical protein